MKKIKLGLSLLLATSFFAVKSQAQTTPYTVTRSDFNTVSSPITLALSSQYGLFTTQFGLYTFNTNGASYPFNGAYTSNLTFKVTINGVTSAPHPFPTTVNQSEVVSATELSFPSLHIGYGVTITCTADHQYVMRTSQLQMP